MTILDINQLKRLISKSGGFPTLPIVVTQLLDVINQYDSSANDVAKVVRRDQSLMAKLLMISVSKA